MIKLDLTPRPPPSAPAASYLHVSVMTPQAFSAAILLALSATSTVFAADSDIDLGIAWARCSKQAELKARLTKDEKEKTNLKGVSAVLHAYGTVAAGEQAAERARRAVEREFIAQMPKDLSSENARRFLRQFNADFEAGAQKCTATFLSNKDRFKELVSEMIAADAKHQSR